MKKTLVALATLAVAGGAFAQSGNARAIDGSGVTIFGVADANFNRITVDGSAQSVTRLVGGGSNESTRLGFRGVEDIGGGWGAGFWLEAGYNQDDGTGQNSTIANTNNGDKLTITTASTAPNPLGSPAVAASYSTATASYSLNGRQGLTFNRAAVVSLLNKGFGEIRVGRDYNPSFWNNTVFDPFGTVGVGSANNVILGQASLNSQVSSNPVPTVRTSNSIGWLSNDMGGIRAQVQYAFSEVPAFCANNVGQTNNLTNSNYCPGQSGDGNNLGFRLQYNSGPIAVAMANSKTTYGNDTTAGTSDRIIWTGATTQSAGTALASTALYQGSPTRSTLTVTNFAGSYTVGAVKVMAQLGQQALADGATTSSSGRKFNYTVLGATYASGAMTWKASYVTGKRSEAASTAAATGGANEDGSKTDQIALGFVYDLSKRSAVYGTYSSLKATAGSGSVGMRATMGLNGDIISAGNSATTTGIDLGVRHRF